MSYPQIAQMLVVDPAAFCGSIVTVAVSIHHAKGLAPPLQGHREQRCFFQPRRGAVIGTCQFPQKFFLLGFSTSHLGSVAFKFHKVLEGHMD